MYILEKFYRSNLLHWQSAGISNKLVTDAFGGYKATDVLNIDFGSNKPVRHLSRAGAEDDFGNRSDGRFDWFRRASNLELRGRFFLQGLSFTLTNRSLILKKSIQHKIRKHYSVAFPIIVAYPTCSKTNF